MTSNVERLTVERQPSVNGTFLRDIPADAADGQLGVAWKKVITGETTSLEVAGHMIAEYRASGRRIVLADFVGNTALKSLGHGEYNDTTSNKRLRSIADYVIPSTLGRAGIAIDGSPMSPVGEIKGFEVKQNQGPIALAALDPSRLGEISVTERQQLIDELEGYIGPLLDPQVPADDKWQCSMSDKLRAVLSRTLLANDSFTEQSCENGSTEKWNLPFDYIASLKALYVLLSHDIEDHEAYRDNSGKLRQGAVWLDNGEKRIAVGCSGLDSAFDEAIAAFYARETLGIESR